MQSPNKLLLALFLFYFPAALVTAQELAEGAEIFNGICAHCHGNDGQGATLGPSIATRVNQDNDQELVAFLRTGNPERGMPPVVVDDQQLPSLLAYMRFLTGNSATSITTASSTPFNSLVAVPAIENFRPVTDEMLLNPDPADWLMYSRTYDAQRFSPLNEINRDNVSQLSLAWSRGLPEGITETIPTVYAGVMYLTMPDGSIAALDATTGDLIWRYQPEVEGRGRSKTMSIYEDMVYFGASDGSVIAIDAVNGQERWRSEANGRDITSGTIVIEGKVLAGGTCRDRESCFISAHDALTGELEWKFYTAQAPDEMPGFDTWAGVPLEERRASTWGLPGGYDQETGLIYWSVANPSPYTRYERHNGDPGAVSYSAPANLYSNSTLAIDPDTGVLNWYYQHLPGDDWDEDMNQERIIFRTPVNPDPEHVKWINPEVQGQERDVIVNVGEGGGLWVLDKYTGEFLWAMPFPEDTENFLIEDIDVTTGATMINRDLILDEPGAHRIICYFNTRSYWPASYNPERNAMYVPYIKNCLNMTSAMPASESMPAMPQSRIGISAPGVPPEELNGMAKVNMETGEITYWVTGPIPTTSSVLTTGGDLLFWGDINRRFRAQDLDTGEVLWETILNGPISTSNITYAVDGRQYVAVITGNNLSAPGISNGTMGPIRLNLDMGSGNSLMVFALPE